MRSALHALLLGVLLTTAGCTGALGGPTGDPAGTVEFPGTTSESSTTGQLAPGLTADGLADPNALVNAHADVLDNQSATLRETSVRRYANGTLRWRTNLTLHTAANRTRYGWIHGATGKPVYGASSGRVEFFADGERVYRKVSTPNSSWMATLRTANGNPEAPDRVALAVARTDDIYVLLNAFALNDSGAVRRVGDDPRRFRLSSSSIAQPGLLASHLDLDAVRNATLTAVVTSEGLVREHRLEYEGVRNGNVVRGVRTLRYEGVGATTVEAPTWYDEVKEANASA